MITFRRPDFCNITVWNNNEYVGTCHIWAGSQSYPETVEKTNSVLEKLNANRDNLKFSRTKEDSVNILNANTDEVITAINCCWGKEKNDRNGSKKASVPSCSLWE